MGPDDLAVEPVERHVNITLVTYENNLDIFRNRLTSVFAIMYIATI